MECKVEVKPFMFAQQTDYGPVEKRFGLDRVYVNGKLGGYAPHDEQDPFCGVFHPLSGFPPEMLAAVVDNSGGKLKGTLAAPKPEPEESEEEDE